MTVTDYITMSSHQRSKMRNSSLRIALLACVLASCSAFVARFSTAVLQHGPGPVSSSQRMRMAVHQGRGGSDNTIGPLIASSLLVGVVLTASPALTPPTALAYDPSDYASETVQSAIQSLKEASGDADRTLKVYEEIAAIITEGKGVGGNINYKGVQLERGYVADEDTTIYNPGLTLLTESEKERLVEAVITARKDGLAKDQWTQDTEFGYSFLKEKLDPLHMVELRSYLGVFPIYSAIVYLCVLAVQQFARGLFPAAYIIGAIAVFAPAIFLVVIGPQ